MNLAFNQNDLQIAMQILQSVALSKSSLPILANVLIEADEDAAVFTATDLQVSASMRVEADVTEPGTATVPAAKLAAFVRELPEDSVVLRSVEGREIAVECSKVSAKLPAISAEDFPRVEMPEKYDFTVPAEALQELIRCTKFAVASEETRYVLNAIFFQAFEDKLSSVATDSMRLAVKSVAVDGIGENVAADESEEEGAPRWSALLPTKAAEELMRAFGPEEEIQVGTIVRKDQQTKQVVFKSGEKTLVSRLQEGNYVEYRELIPKENSIRVSVGRDSLMNAIRRVSQFSDRSTLRLALKIKEDSIGLSSTSASGQAEEEIPAESTEPIDIDFKHTFLAEAVEAVRSEDVIIDFKDQNSAAIVRESDSGEEYICVVMPLMK